MSDDILPSLPSQLRGGPSKPGRRRPDCNAPCMERVLPPCRERTVKGSLPAIEGARSGKTSGSSPHYVSLAINAVTSALACGEITPVGLDSRRIAA